MTRYILAAIIAVSLIVARTAAAEEDLAVQIKALQNERVETLTKLVAYCRTEFAVGMRRCEAVIAAETDLVNAQMDAANKPEERIAMLTERVKSQTEFLKIVEGKRQMEAVGLANVYRARSLLLNTEIMLLRERSSQKKARR